MAAPSYTTNLSLFEDFEAANTISTEVVGYTETAKGSGVDSDFPIQGSQHASAEQRATGTGSLVSDFGANLTWTSGWNIFMWGVFLAPAAVATDSNAGIEMMVGSSIAEFHRWTVGGNDFGRYPYGGWQNFVINPEITVGRTTVGAPGTNYRWSGMLCNVIAAITKGSPYGIDVIRYGRGDIVVTAGDLTNGYSTFVGMAAQNDNNNNRWGLFSSQAGSYIWKGLMTLGTSGTAVDFRDSNKTIVIDETRRILSTFNRIEINNASSNVEWTNITFSSLSTVSLGQLEVIDDATVLIDGSSFNNMDTFILQSNSTVTNSVFNSCNSINTGGGVFTGTKVDDSTVGIDESAIIWNSTNNPDGYLDDMEFTKGTNAHHAIELGLSSPTTITLQGMIFDGFNAANGQNDSVIYVARTTGTVTIQAVECTGIVTYKSAGAIVVVTQGVVTKVTVKDINTSGVIQDARVILAVADNSNFPYLDVVTITSASTTATVTHTAHGLITNDWVSIEGVDSTGTQNVYNGAHQITVTGVNTYTYTMQATTTSPAVGYLGGNITSTLLIINGLTDVSGVISDQRAIVVNQQVTGRVRKSTLSPLYKTQIISDTIDSTTGKDLTILMVSDES